MVFPWKRSKKAASKKPIKYLSLFSGIGGFELGLLRGLKKKTKLSASDIQKSIDTQKKSTKDTSHIPTLEMSGISTPKSSPISTSCVQDFLARHFQSPESEKASAIVEVRYFLKSQGSLNKNGHAFYCLKTSKGFYLTTKAIRSLQSLPRLMNWGMIVNGKLLTQKITESHKTGNEYSLSDILEDRPDPKYFLSEGQTKKLLKRTGFNRMPIQDK